MTSAPSGSFTPSRPGDYYVWVDVADASGRTLTTDRAKVSVGTPIMAVGQSSVDQMVRCYRSSGFVYPAAVYLQKGAGSIEEFCTLIWITASSEGVNPDVLFAQAMHETGWLQFGGDVEAGQCNFGGLGATGGVSGLSFADVRQGLLAQSQHLKAYASKEPLNNPCVDPRFGYVQRGVAPYVENLGAGIWASDKLYGEKLAALISGLHSA